MTRENKLALVVGFGLILFIGILISDHFSVARGQQSANLTNRAIDDPLAGHARDEPDLIALKPEPPPTAPFLQPADAAVNPSHMVAGNAHQPPLESMTPEQRSMIDRNVGLVQHAQGQSPPRDVQPVDTLAPQTGQAEITTIASRSQEDVDLPGFVRVEDGQAVTLKDVVFHDVRGGESLFAICQKYYGDTALVQELARFNKMDDPAHLRAGRRLLIPNAQTLGGKSKAQPAKQRSPANPSALRNTAVASSKAKPAAKTYTVKSGDSLSGIAQRFLGDREKWRDLARINRRVIDDPDNIKTGTVLKLG